MKQIPLTQGQVALVDDEDFEELSKVKWCAMWDAGTRSFYAMRNTPWVNGNRTSELMHRRILNAQPDQQVDHINHDTLDNRWENIRLCTHTQNHQNQTKHAKASSQFKGVCWNKQCRKWMVHIVVNAKSIYLGLFTDETKAAQAYDEAAKKHFGEYALLNFVVASE